MSKHLPFLFEISKDLSLDATSGWAKGGWPPKDPDVWFVGYWGHYGPSCFRWSEEYGLFATDSGEVLDKAIAPDFYQKLTLPQ